MHDNAGANWPGALLGMLFPLPQGQAEPTSLSGVAVWLALVRQWPKSHSGMDLGGPVSRWWLKAATLLWCEGNKQE